MKKIFTFLATALIAITAHSQISHGGQPFNWNAKTLEPVEFQILPDADIAKLRKEDKILDDYKDVPYRFGANIPVDFDLENSGKWKDLENGDRMWQLAVSSPGARSINLVFDTYILPEGGKVFVYDEQKSQLLGSFTNENASAINSLGIGFLFADKAIIEYYEPAAARGFGQLHINNITHGYRNALKREDSAAKQGPFGDSDPCNINVKCPIALPYNAERRSVAIIVVNNNGSCSGSLINNTAQNQTPYFLTANHCLPFNTTNTNNWVFYFNHENPDCNGNDPAPTNQSVSGAVLRARNNESDFALVEINASIPADYQVCYAGWDATDIQNVTSAVGMHHPGGDTKKFCHEANPPYHQSTAFNGNQNTKMWWIDEWEDGVTEGGSSGSPLFNQNGRIIGQLAGGAAACNGTVNNGEFDFYGRFGVSWDFGSTSTTNAKSWLDPNNTGVETLGPLCIGALDDNDVTLINFTNVEPTLCQNAAFNPVISVTNTGSNAITSISLSLLVNSAPIGTTNWTGNLASFETINITLETVELTPGLSEITAEVITVNGTADNNMIGNSRTTSTYAFNNSGVITVNIDFDDYASETTWTITDDSGYVFYSGGGYSDGDNSISESLCLESTDCYVFTIFDDFGDGISSEQFGVGSYEVLDNNGSVVASGGEFANLEATAFCAGPLSAKNAAFENVKIYPNPSAGLVAMQLNEDVLKTLHGITISDALGRVLFNQTANLKNTYWSHDLSSYGSGLYFITLDSDLGRSTKKVVIY